MILGNHEVLSEISRGPITTVYKTRNTQLNRLELLKVLNVQWQDEKEFVERFRREARICAQLKHPNIVDVYDYNFKDGHFYIAMEYINGTTLQQMLNEKKPLPFDEVLRLSVKILNALDYAHNMGVLHRDLKPGNIMVDDKGEIKITDFGMASLNSMPNITEQDVTLGTPAYMSPEQALGKKLEKRSDLFSFGVLCYELVSGISPFKDENIAATITKVLQENPLPLGEITPQIPRWFDQLINRLLDKDVRNRPVSAREILKIIEEQQAPSGRGNERSFQLKPLALSAAVVLILASGWYGLTNFVNKSREMSPTHNEPATSLNNFSPEDSSKTNITKTPSMPGEKSTRMKSLTDSIPQMTPGDNSEDAGGTLNSSTVITSGRLMIICKPWANIYIDSIKVDTTPLNKAITVISGDHLLELRNPNFETFKQKITIAPGITDSVVASLNPLTGYLMVYVSPWAKIYLDGKYRETTPLNEPLLVKPGKYTLMLKHPDFASITDTITIYSGETFTRRFSFIH